MRWSVTFSARTLPIGALAMALAAPAGSADKAKKPGNHQVGPFYLTPRLLLKDAGVDTNVFHTLNNPTRDAVVVLTPRLDAALPLGRFRATGFGFVDVNYYRRANDERSTDFYAEGRAELDAGPFTFFGGGGGGQFTQRFSIDVDERLERQEKRGHAGTTIRAGRRLSATAQGTSEVYQFAPGEFRLGGDIKEAMDRNTLTATGQVRYALTSRTTLVVSADAIEDRFLSDPVPATRVRQSYRYMGGVELGARAFVTGRLLLGMREFPGAPDEGSPSYQGPVVSADLAFPVGRAGRLRLMGDRDVFYASSLVDVGPVRYRNGFVLERWAAEALLALPGSLIALVGAGFEEATYLFPYPYPNDHVFSQRVDHRYTATFGLNRRLGETLRVGGYLSWARRVSSLPLFSYEGLRYGLNAEITP